MSSYCENLFTKDDHILSDMLLDKVQPKVTQEMNLVLCKTSLIKRLKMLSSKLDL